MTPRPARPECKDRDLRADYDFRPDESTVRVFTTPESGVLRLDDDVAITEAVENGVVLRHYAFGDRWFKINVTTDLQGSLVETGDPQNRFAFNCDIATPMERDGSAIYGVDLFVDVLVRADLRSIHAVIATLPAMTTSNTSKTGSACTPGDRCHGRRT